MNDKSKTEKTAFEISKEEFQQMLEKQERSKPLEDEALEQFVKKPKKLNLYDKIISSVDFILLFFLLSKKITKAPITVDIPAKKDNIKAYKHLFGIIYLLLIYMLKTA